MFFDTHMHSEFSFDSKMTVNEILEKQKLLNIGVCLTEHIDLDLPDFPVIDMDKYLSFYNEYRNDNFLVGIEIGMAKVNSAKTENFANTFKDSLDMIIGSVHSLYGRDLFYLMKETDKPKNEIYKDYLENMLFCVKEFDFFDTLAHIDYIARYSTYEDKELYLSDFPDLIDKILSTLVVKNKCLELNTRRISDKKAYLSLIDIFKRYKHFGGQFVTLASDSHTKEDIASNFELTSSFLNECNLQAVYFKNRQMIKL